MKAPRRPRRPWSFVVMPRCCAPERELSSGERRLCAYARVRTTRRRGPA
jgi:hypothetical protein